MRNFVKSICVLLFVIFLASCTQYRIIPYPVDTDNGNQGITTGPIRNAGDLQDRLNNANLGDIIDLNGLNVDLSKDRSLLPFRVPVSVTLTGNMTVTDSTGTTMTMSVLSQTATGSFSLFEVVDGVTFTVSDVTVSIPIQSIAEEIRAIVSVDKTASVTIDNVVVDKPASVEKKIYIVEVGKEAGVGAITIAKPEPPEGDIPGGELETPVIEIVIDENNQNASAIIDDLEVQQGASTNVDASTPYDVATPDEFKAVLSEQKKVVLTADITAPLTSLTDGGTYDINLNSHTLTLTDTLSGIDYGTAVFVSRESILAISNGTIIYDTSSIGNDSAFQVDYGATLKLVNVDLESSATGIALFNENTKLFLEDCYVGGAGYYAVCTNASTACEGTVIDIKKSRIIHTGENAALLFNVNGTLTLEDSYVEGGHQGLIARGGTISIVNSDIYSIGKADIEGDENVLLFHQDGTIPWGQGNQVAYAALVIGNAQEGTGYNYDTVVTLDDDSSVLMQINEGVNDGAATIFIASANGFSATLNCNNTAYRDEIVANDWIWGAKCYFNTELLTDADLQSDTIGELVEP